MMSLRDNNEMGALRDGLRQRGSCLGGACVSWTSAKVVSGWRTWYIYAGTQLISEYEDSASNNYSSPTSPGGVSQYTTELYQHSDHLTTRFTTDNSGLTGNQQGHYPFGEVWYTSGQADPSVRRKFTSYMQDDEAATGKINYAYYRQHSARLSRFLRPDPVFGNMGNPQRLNRYAYVAGDPVSRIDPDGREAIADGNEWNPYDDLMYWTPGDSCSVGFDGFMYCPGMNLKILSGGGGGGGGGGSVGGVGGGVGPRGWLGGGGLADEPPKCEEYRRCVEIADAARKHCMIDVALDFAIGEGACLAAGGLAALVGTPAAGLVVGGGCAILEAMMITWPHTWLCRREYEGYMTRCETIRLQFCPGN